MDMECPKSMCRFGSLVLTNGDISMKCTITLFPLILILREVYKAKRSKTNQHLSSLWQLRSIYLPGKDHACKRVDATTATHDTPSANPI